MALAVLGIGGDTGDQRSIHAECIDRIESRIGVVRAVSSAYWNGSVGFDSEQLFLNRCVTVDVDMQPQELLRAVQELELEFGRERCGNGYASRTLDIDVVAIGSEELLTEQLVVPHPRMHERAFVLVPMAEVLPDWEHPKLKKNLGEMMQALAE